MFHYLLIGLRFNRRQAFQFRGWPIQTLSISGTFHASAATTDATTTTRATHYCFSLSHMEAVKPQHGEGPHRPQLVTPTAADLGGRVLHSGSISIYTLLLFLGANQLPED